MSDVWVAVLWWQAWCCFNSFSKQKPDACSELSRIDLQLKPQVKEYHISHVSSHMSVKKKNVRASGNHLLHCLVHLGYLFMQVKNRCVVHSPVLTNKNSDLYLGVFHDFPLLYTEITIKTRQTAMCRELSQQEFIGSL